MKAFLLQYKDAALRAAKTAAQTFIGVILAAWLNGGNIAFSALLDTLETQSDFALGSAILAAATALGWNARSSRRESHADDNPPAPHPPR
jgi:hypothetical protein